MTVRVVAVSVAHPHVHDLLAGTESTPGAELVGLCDEAPADRVLPLAATAERFGLGPDRTFEDVERCLEATDADLALVTGPPADHADYVERIAPSGAAVLVEKPFALTLAGADRAVEAADAAGVPLAVNWPLAWYPTHRTTKRLLDEGRIGDVRAVHYFDGNRSSGRFADLSYGPDGDLQGDDAPAYDSWWFDPERGGGSLVDYLGYGTTLATWFRDGALPETVSTTTHVPPDLAVDVHSLTAARYGTGLSKFETAWDTFTDPWEHQPLTRCGFVVEGTEGSVASYDYRESVTVQTREHPDGREVPVDDLPAPRSGPVEYVVDRLERDAPIEFGPLTPGLNRDAQRIVETARRSAAEGRALDLVD